MSRLQQIIVLGIPVWLCLIGGFLMIAGGVNQVGGGIINAVIKADNFIATIGAGITLGGLSLGLVYIFLAIRNSLK